MKALIDVLIISAIACFVINSGAVETFKHLLWRWLRGGTPYKEYSLKPFDCELCMTWWCGLIYIIITHNVSLANVLYVALVAWCTPVIVDLLHLLVDIPRWLIELARKVLKL